jgi:hypothetical protein
VVPTGSSHGLLLFAGRFFDQQRADSSLIRLSDYPEPPLGSHLIYKLERTHVLEAYSELLRIHWKPAYIQWARPALGNPSTILSDELWEDVRLGDEPAKTVVVDALMGAPPLRLWSTGTERTITVPTTAIDLVSLTERLERRTRAHEELVATIAQRAVVAEIEPVESSVVDLFIERRLIVEVKTITQDAVAQTRSALSQLYYYRFLYRNVAPAAKLLAVFSSMPTVHGRRDYVP